VTVNPRTLASLFLVLSATVLAQTAAPAPPRNVGQTADFWIAQVESEVVAAAKSLPEPKYSFAPVDGQFAGVRTFGEQIKHLAAASYQLGAATLGEQPPAGTDHETAPPNVKTKEQIMEYLKGSFTCLHRAAAALNEQNMNDPIADKGNRTRLQLMIDAVVHSSNHYGQMVEYLRMNGIVPPASR